MMVMRYIILIISIVANMRVYIFVKSRSLFFFFIFILKNILVNWSHVLIHINKPSTEITRTV